MSVIQHRSGLRYNSWTVLGPRDDVAADIIGFAVLYLTGDYASFSTSETTPPQVIRRAIETSKVGRDIVRDFRRKLSAVPGVDLGVARGVWSSQARSLNLPEVLLVIGRRLDNGIITATLYCGPAFDPFDQMQKIQAAARIIARQSGR